MYPHLQKYKYMVHSDDEDFFSQGLANDKYYIFTDAPNEKKNWLVGEKTIGTTAFRAKGFFFIFIIIAT